MNRVRGAGKDDNMKHNLAVLTKVAEPVESGLFEGFEMARPNPVDRALSVRSAEPAPPLRIRSHNGEVNVDGRPVAIPRGLGRKLTVAALRQLADIYRGLSIFIESGGSHTRLKDSDPIEITRETEVVSRDERPQRVVSRLSFHTD